MTALVRIALSRPYTFIVLALLLLIIGPLAALRTPTDIFPDIRIPVIGVVWQYTGLPPDQMSGRIITPYQRILTTTVNDIEHITANSYNGIGIVKIFFQPNADIRTANAQVTAVSQTIIKQMPPGATPPLILNYSASTVPIIQLALSGEGLTEQNLADIAINQLRTPLVTVPGAAIPYPYGGKQRQIEIDVNPSALQSLGLSGQDVANALAAQNLIQPAGTSKIGGFEYFIQLNNSPLKIEELGDLPIKAVNGAMVYVRDVATVRDGNPPQTNIVHVNGSRSVLMMVLKSGYISTLDIIDGIKKKVVAFKDFASRHAGRRFRRRPGAVRQRRDRRRGARGRDCGAAHQHHDPPVPGKLAFDDHHRHLDSARRVRLDRDAVGDRRNPQYHDARRPRARGRNPR